jgi:UDP-2,3-diacylglucosamine pyrophosphatase LpxH
MPISSMTTVVYGSLVCIILSKVVLGVYLDKRALIIPDCHIPYHDKAAYNLMLDVASTTVIDEVIILGDYADFYDVNSHGKSREVRLYLKEEIEAVHGKLAELQKRFPKAKKKYIIGNHEWRLFRFICNKAPELFEIVDVRTLLQLEKYGFEAIPYTPDQGTSVLGSSLIARHEPSKKAGCSIIHGHDHRFHSSKEITLDGKTLTTIGSGWLGNKNHPVMQYVKNHHQWQLGFTIITVLDNGLWFDTKVEIVPSGNKYYCIYEGYKYEAPIQSWV